MNVFATLRDMIESGDSHLPHVQQQLTKTEVAKAAVTNGIIGLGLFVLGLAAIVSIGELGTLSGTGILAVFIGLGCFLLMLPSVLLLGVGILHLSLSIVVLYSLIVGKPLYRFTLGIDLRRNCPDSM